ncbi:hypothetical protein HPB52_022456 [Rhipicephalus sanguineus]|uniref:Uncharacterized protein n=1 Tax=Rhipicephalus sanguineus TaxID=34632 RepID=A0A9D4T202_RHISA|nr:hypothetical protein HPB52_022456 [Rhipicephalus sanguineus]
MGGIIRSNKVSGTEKNTEVSSKGFLADSVNGSGVTSETEHAADSPVVGDRSDGVTVRELLNAAVEKYHVLTALLERLAPSATPQPVSAGTPGRIAEFQLMPGISSNIPNFDGCDDEPSARNRIENLRTTATLHSWPESFKRETAKSRLTGPARDWLRSSIRGEAAAERWRKMHERVQLCYETSVVYFHAEVRLCNEADLDF